MRSPRPTAPALSAQSSVDDFIPKPHVTTYAMLADVERQLVDAMARAARGPDRNAYFALWLVVRICDGLLPPDALTERLHLVRLWQLERRLSSLSLRAPLRRAIAGGLRAMQTPAPETAGAVLHQLVAPAADTVGPVAAAALAAAANTARTAAKDLVALSCHTASR